MKKFFIHPSAIVETKDIGENTKIWAFAHILDNVKIGSDCNICDFCFLESNVVVGNKVTVKNGVSIWNGIILEDEVFVGPNVAFTNDKMPRSKEYPQKFPITLVKKGASIGANATILPGITIGKYAMVGAGSVVTRDVRDYCMVVGNPAKFTKFICKCCEPITFNKGNHYNCKCGRNFKLEANNVFRE